MKSKLLLVIGVLVGMLSIPSLGVTGVLTSNTNSTTVNSATIPASKTVVGTNSSGQIVDATSSVVPYTGATANLDLGNYRYVSGILVPEVDGHTDGAVLTAVQVSSTQIHNIGQGANNVNLTLPAAVSGLSTIMQVGESSANYWRLTANAGDAMNVDGVAGKTYASFATPGRGNFLACRAVQEKQTARLAIGTTPANVGTESFTFSISGTKYLKSAVPAGTAPGDDVIITAKYGAVAFDIGANGTIDAIEATNQAAAQFATEAEAIAALPAAEAAHFRMGYVTATKSDGNFTFGATSLAVANSTVAYYSSAGTAVYNWVCNTGAGSVTTD